MPEWISFVEAAAIVTIRARLSNAAEVLSAAIEAGRVRSVRLVPEFSPVRTVPGGLNFYRDGTMAGKAVDSRTVHPGDLDDWLNVLMGSGVAKLASPKVARRRGPRPEKTETVKAAMRNFDRAILLSMTEEAMSAQFKASRDTCRKARAKLLSE